MPVSYDFYWKPMHAVNDASAYFRSIEGAERGKFEAFRAQEALLSVGGNMRRMMKHPLRTWGGWFKPPLPEDRVHDDRWDPRRREWAWDASRSRRAPG